MSEPSPKAETLEDPWHKHKSLSNTKAIWQVLDINGELVCSCPFEWDADDIIREHNAHAALVEACENAWNWFEVDEPKSAVQVVEQIRAALAVAKANQNKE